MDSKRKEKLFIVFRKPMYNPFGRHNSKERMSIGGISDNILRYVCRLGEHIHCEVFVPHMRCGNELGFSFTNFSGDKMQLRSDMKNSYIDTPHYYTCMVVHVNQREYDKFISQNLALVQRHVPYNYSDCVLTMFPKVFQDTFIQDQIQETPVTSYDQLTQVQSLFCAQSIILTLRVSLDKDHLLYTSLNNLTARCTTPQELYLTIQKHVGEHVAIQQTITKL
jgi:hypothetical protein